MNGAAMVVVLERSVLILRHVWVWLQYEVSERAHVGAQFWRIFHIATVQLAIGQHLVLATVYRCHFVCYWCLARLRLWLVRVWASSRYSDNVGAMRPIDQADYDVLLRDFNGLGQVDTRGDPRCVFIGG
jgi:hypothetical protein